MNLPKTWELDYWELKFCVGTLTKAKTSLHKMINKENDEASTTHTKFRST